jgi:hypothetical protein
MKKKLRATSKISPPPNIPPPKGDTNDIPFHIEFPIELHHDDNGESKTCWFKDKIDCKKYIQRNKLKLNEIEIQTTKQK